MFREHFSRAHPVTNLLLFVLLFATPVAGVADEVVNYDTDNSAQLYVSGSRECIVYPLGTDYSLSGSFVVFRPAEASYRIVDTGIEEDGEFWVLYLSIECDYLLLSHRLKDFSSESHGLTTIYRVKLDEKPPVRIDRGRFGSPAQSKVSADGRVLAYFLASGNVEDVGIYSKLLGTDERSIRLSSVIGNPAIIHQFEVGAVSADGTLVAYNTDASKFGGIPGSVRNPVLVVTNEGAVSDEFTWPRHAFDVGPCDSLLAKAISDLGAVLIVTEWQRCLPCVPNRPCYENRTLPKMFIATRDGEVHLLHETLGDWSNYVDPLFGLRVPKFLGFVPGTNHVMVDFYSTEGRPCIRVLFGAGRKSECFANVSEFIYAHVISGDGKLIALLVSDQSFGPGRRVRLKVETFPRPLVEARD